MMSLRVLCLVGYPAGLVLDFKASIIALMIAPARAGNSVLPCWAPVARKRAVVADVVAVAAIGSSRSHLLKILCRHIDRVK